jgi:hypothetical protein
MPATYFTTEDQLVSDLVSYWTATPITGLTGVTVVSFRTAGVLPVPALIVGHEGAEREKSKGMSGTRRVALRLVLRTDLDVTPAATHHALAAIVHRALEAFSLPGGPLALTHLHALLPESPDTTVEDRRQLTVLRFQAIATRMETA